MKLSRKERLHRRALRLEWFTVGRNVVEAVVAIGASLIVGSIALVGFGTDSGSRPSPRWPSCGAS